MGSKGSHRHRWAALGHEPLASFLCTESRGHKPRKVHRVPSTGSPPRAAPCLPVHGVAALRSTGSRPKIKPNQDPPRRLLCVRPKCGNFALLLQANSERLVANCLRQTASKSCQKRHQLSGLGTRVARMRSLTSRLHGIESERDPLRARETGAPVRAYSVRKMKQNSHVFTRSRPRMSLGLTVFS